MKWDEPPLWPVAVPSLVGFAAAAIPYLFPNTPQLVGGELTTPFILLVIISPLLYFSPEPTGGRAELILGANIGMFFAFFPQAIFFVWFIIIILLWLAQSMYVWRRNYPAFRIGTWIGLGAVSGLYIGGLFGHLILV